MNIKMNKRIICISGLILMILVSSIGFSYAATTSELRDQQSDIDAKIEQTNTEIAGVKKQMTNALNQINSLNSEISGYENDILKLQKQLEDVNAQITEKTNNIQEQQEKYDTQKDLLEQRLVALYEAGETTYLDMLLASEDLSDFISNYYLIEQMADADEELLASIENTRKQLEAEKEYLDSAKTEIENTTASIAEKKQSLSKSVSQKKNVVSNLTAEEAELQAQLEEFEEDKRRIQAELAKIASNYSGEVVAPSAAGYICPINGKSKRNITTGYYGYKGHTGVDFACSPGTPIVAVKSGTVVTSTALKNSKGKYRSYGEYVVINHHDGTMTLYAHMLSGSRTVVPNQKVSQGQVIGQVGSTGNSTGPHLHFEVRIGGSPVNPTPYLP
ncbi:MAG: peptidoglycan DD-metalloendopeptidase family protein [Clostridia bacterium]|nr:peptidoglycan DD-metalloendopeptidase family protein [Clostridia bacterium]